MSKIATNFAKKTHRPTHESKPAPVPILYVLLLSGALLAHACDGELNPYVHPCFEVDCSGQGQCVLSQDDRPACMCNTGFHADGLSCLANSNPCEDVTCTGHGTCAVQDETTPICSCEAGFYPLDLDCIAEGLQLNEICENQVDDDGDGLTDDDDGDCPLAGNVDVYYRGQGIVPAGPLTAGITFRIGFDLYITPYPTGDGDSTSIEQEEYFFEALASADSWTIESSMETILVPMKTGVRAYVSVSVTPSEAETEAILYVRATNVRDNRQYSTQLPVLLSIGETPPVRYLFYSGPLNIDGESEIPQDQLARPSGRNLLAQLRGDEYREASVQMYHRLVLDVLDTTGWEPLEWETGELVHLKPAGIGIVDTLAAVRGPEAAPVGTRGRVEIRMELLELDGELPPSPHEETMIIPFVITSSE